MSLMPHAEPVCTEAAAPPTAGGAMLVLRTGAPVCITALEPARVVALGGAPIDGERHIFWNFVSSSRERIEQAKDDWRNRRFPTVPGDAVEFIPLPDSR